MNEASPKALETVDIMKLLASLPHRYPFLLVDKIIECNGDQSCIGIKNVTFNEPHFQGHFPGQPVMPGVLLIEGMAQTAGALCVNASATKTPRIVYFMTINNAKFRRPVVPGDRVEFHMTKTNQRRNMWWYSGIAKVDGQVVCEAEISAMLVSDQVPGS